MNINDLLREAEQEIPAAFGYPGWTYRDLPWMKTTLMEEFRERMTADNLVLITYMENTQRQICRGQCLISPRGMEILAEIVSEANGNTNR